MPQQARARPGWYPDPTSTVPLLRYWDGARWTGTTRLTADAGGRSAAPPDRPRRRWWQAVKWGAVAAFVLAAAVAGVALLRGQEVCSVSTSGVLVFAPKGGVCVAKSELAQAQQDLRQEVAGPKAQASAAAVPTTLTDLNGRWAGPGGSVYVITQGGTDATIEEYLPNLGLTATGVGTVADGYARFDFTAFNGASGVAEFTEQAPGTLIGTLTSNAVGSAPIMLQRMG